MSAVIIIIMRPFLRPLSSTSRGTREELSETIQGGLSRGVGDGSLRLVSIGPIEMTVSSSDMIVLGFGEGKGIMNRKFI